MIKGIGIDLIEISRIKKTIQQNDRFVHRVLTEKEKKIFFSLQSEQRRLEFLSGRFAAKEAFAKAVGTGIGKLSFQHIEVLTDSLGGPVVTAVGYESCKIFISISHSREYAVAQVLIEESTESNG
ncbi:MAG TPA: holo-ACP synthase [Bacillota bacterium]